jgi:hypothetical protein
MILVLVLLACWYDARTQLRRGGAAAAVSSRLKQSFLHRVPVVLCLVESCSATVSQIQLQLALLVDASVKHPIFLFISTLHHFWKLYISGGNQAALAISSSQPEAA